MVLKSVYGILQPEVVIQKKTIDDEEVFLPQEPASVLIARHRRNRTVFCFLLPFVAVFVLALSVLATICLYKVLNKPYVRECSIISRQYGSEFEFQEQIETDQETYEKITVPKIRNFKEATFLHDFDMNYTAIVDKQGAQCFVMPLNYSIVKPPKDLWDLISKVETEYYRPDEDTINENYQVLEPAVQDSSQFGHLIWAECHLFKTYSMMRIDDVHDMPHAIAKRSTCQIIQFIHSAGKPVSYNIIGCLEDM